MWNERRGIDEHFIEIIDILIGKACGNLFVHAHEANMYLKMVKVLTVTLGEHRGQVGRELDIANTVAVPKCSGSFLAMHLAYSRTAQCF